MSGFVIQLLSVVFATAGFSLIIRVPLRHIPACVIIGAMGWVAYQTSMYYYAFPALGCFAGACVVGLLSNIAARLLRDASTIFIIPGILCLVPGSKIYSTMDAVLRENFSLAAQVGTQTLLMAGAIAVGLMTIGAVIHVVYALAGKALTL